MKNSSSKSLTSLVPSIIAIICLVVLAGSVQPQKKAANTAAVIPCCLGYSIQMDQLRQFMLDSLKSGSFEGGIYSKKDLLKAINSINGDSVYLMNAMLNCLMGEGNGMIVTSPATGDLKIISKNPYCAPCPQRACCPQKICATRINRSCINYRDFNGITGISENDMELTATTDK
ncbi:hypothetical protein BH10BAC2_BH10BAC2_44390 [soil metagenome]